ncbi:MAG: homocysteine S-methyltransferase family protein [Candidatus Bipolaricaulia bacterium]
MSFYDRFLDAGRVPLFDGAIGTMLQRHEEFASVRLGEELNLVRPDLVRRVHQQYLEAGADLATTNTFSANRVRLSEVGLENGLEELNRRGVKLAREGTEGKALVAGSIGPLGKLMGPFGPIKIDEAVEAFAEQAQILEEAGADLIIIETMSWPVEIKAAVIAVKESTDLPVIASMTYTDRGRTISGTDPATAANILGNLGVDVIGANCSVGPAELLEVAEAYRKSTNLPTLVEANAGQPRLDWKAGGAATAYEVGIDEFATNCRELLKVGVDMIGACCGSTPEYIKRLKEVTEEFKPIRRDSRYTPAVSSRTRTLPLSGESSETLRTAVVPLGKGEDIRSIPGKARDACKGENGASIVVLDLKDLDAVESEKLSELEDALTKAQASCSHPLGFRVSTTAVLKSCLRACEGIPLVIADGAGKDEHKEIENLVGKYGGVLQEDL